MLQKIKRGTIEREVWVGRRMDGRVVKRSGWSEE